MAANITIDHASFRAGALKLLAATKKSVSQLLKDQARLLTRDVLKSTPPFAKASITESFNVQRKTGQAAVARDIRRVFMDSSGLNILRAPRNEILAASLTKAIRSRNTATVTKLLALIGVPVRSVSAELDPGLHRARRTPRGRVPKGGQRNFVMSARALPRYIKEVQSHVGRAKAGWGAAATALRTPMPNWISRHATPGNYIDETGGGLRAVQAITIINRVRYGGEFRTLRIVEFAMRNRARAMHLQAERIIAAELRRANRGTAARSF